MLLPAILLTLGDVQAQTTERTSAQAERKGDHGKNRRHRGFRLFPHRHRHHHNEHHEHGRDQQHEGVTRSHNR